jgi:hypothetical protein
MQSETDAFYTGEPDKSQAVRFRVCGERKAILGAPCTVVWTFTRPLRIFGLPDVSNESHPHPAARRAAHLSPTLSAALAVRLASDNLAERRPGNSPD